MQKFLIPILLSGSLMLSVSCSRQPWSGLERAEVNDCLLKHLPDYLSERYKSEIEIAGRSFGGILVVKKMNDHSTRVVFTGDAGITFFDMEFKGETFKVHYITKKLDRKPVIRQLREDIRLVLMSVVKSKPDQHIINGGESIHVYNQDKKTTGYFTSSDCTKLIKAEIRSNNKLKTTASFYETGKSLPDSVFIKHESIHFTISLKKLKQL